MKLRSEAEAVLTQDWARVADRPPAAPGARHVATVAVIAASAACQPGDRFRSRRQGQRHLTTGGGRSHY
jgi:hypothetical protein